MAINTDLQIRIAATNAASATLAGLQKDLDGLKKQVLEVGAAFLGAFAVKNVLDSMNSWSEGVRRIQSETGLTAESSSRLNFIAQALGISSDELATSLGRLDKTMFAVAAKAKQQDDVFHKWGITLKDAHGNVRNVNDILIDAAARVKSLGDGAAATALEMDLFGRSGGKLHELLMKGAEGVQELANQSDELGLTLNGQTLGAMRDAAEKGRIFGLAMEGLQVTIGNFLLPILTTIVQAVTKFISGITNGIKTSQLFAGVLKAVGEVLRRLMGFFKEIADAAGRFLDAVGKKGLLGALGDLAGDIGKAVLKLFGDIGEKLDSFGPLGTIAKDALIALGAIEVINAIAGAAKKVIDLVESIKKIPAKTLYTIDVVLVGIAIAEVAQTVKEIADNWELARTAAHNGALEQQADSNAWGALTLRRLVEWGDFFNTLGTNTRNAFDGMGVIVSGAFDGIKSAIKGKLDEIAENFRNIINGLISYANKIPGVNISPVHAPPGTTGGGGGPGGLPGDDEQTAAAACERRPWDGAPGTTGHYQWNWSDHTCFPVWDQTGSGTPPGGGGRPFASGGIVTRPTRALIGEAGPEAVIPLGNGGTIGNTTINVYVSGNVTESEDALAEKVGDRIMRQLTHSRSVSF